MGDCVPVGLSVDQSTIKVLGAKRIKQSILGFNSNLQCEAELFLISVSSTPEMKENNENNKEGLDSIMQVLLRVEKKMNDIQSKQVALDKKVNLIYDILLGGE